MDMQHTNERYTNVMRIPVSGEGRQKAMYLYVKPTISSCKCTFADGTTYFQKVIPNDKRYNFKSEENKLYMDEECTVAAGITRKQKIRQCKSLGLI